MIWHRIAKSSPSEHASPGDQMLGLFESQLQRHALTDSISTSWAMPVSAAQNGDTLIAGQHHPQVCLMSIVELYIGTFIQSLP